MDFSSQAGSSNGRVVVRADLKERYVRYNKIIGKGVWKKIYLGFDKVNGIEIAWSVTALTKKTRSTKINHQMLCAEGDLLKSLEHENILRCYSSWNSNPAKNRAKAIHITELFTSGNLLDYANKHNLANNIPAIKILARQILKGLHYLHTHSPRIVHGDITCENIFVNGNTGCVKLANFGLATVLEQEISETPEFTAPVIRGPNKRRSSRLATILEQENSETPEFMAQVTQGPNKPLSDIFSFGMCILQMVTRELPYFSRDGKPAALSRVTDPEVMRFIEMCLADESERPTAIGLLNDPFLATSVSGTLTASSSLSPRESECNPVTGFINWVVCLCQGQQEQRGESENEWQRQEEQEQRGESGNEEQRQQ